MYASHAEKKEGNEIKDACEEMSHELNKKTSQSETERIVKAIRTKTSEPQLTLEKTRSSAIAVIADRTACSILTLFIVTATSRPLNKKDSFAVSPRIQLTITADLRPQIRSPHTSLHVQYSAQAHRTALCHRSDSQARSATNAITVCIGAQVCSAWQFVFCGAFCG